MAIVLKEQKKRINWFVFLVFIFFLVIIIGGAYLLFFTPLPGIETLAPSTLKSTTELSQVDFDPAQIISNPTLNTLRQYGNLPSVGNLGRDNPFLGF